VLDDLVLVGIGERCVSFFQKNQRLGTNGRRRKRNHDKNRVDDHQASISTFDHGGILGRKDSNKKTSPQIMRAGL
jgi:hypothetical protein